MRVEGTAMCSLVVIALLFHATILCGDSYTIRNPVSWAVTNDILEEEVGAASDEEVAPALLVNNVGIWKQQAYPPTAYADRAENPQPKTDKDLAHVSSPAARVFSYRMEAVNPPAKAPPPPPHEETAKTARYVAHYSDWGHLATLSTQDKVS